MAETFLGDGLYAAFDGFGVTLRAPREDGDHWVYLEPHTLEELSRFFETEQAKAARSR